MSVYILVHNTKPNIVQQYLLWLNAVLSFITKVLLTKLITYTTATNIQLNKGFRHNILKKSILSIKICKAIQVGPVMLRSTQ